MTITLISDPWFYATAVPATLLFGISKGGFGGGLGVLAVPLMALTVSPLQAAAILLPILCLMDLFSLRAFWGKWLTAELRVLLPASLVGIGIGTATFDMMNADVIRLLLGTIAIVFTLHHVITAKANVDGRDRPGSRQTGALAAAVSGFTSFVAHAGGPPLSMYLLRRGLDRTTFAATAVAFFAVVNFVKLLPYAWLGQLDLQNLGTSAVLSPLAPLGIGLGFYLHRRVNDRVFFFIAYVMLFVVGVKLLFDGLTALTPGFAL